MSEPAKTPAPAAGGGGSGGPKLLILLVLAAANLGATGFMVMRTLKAPKVSLTSEAAAAELSKEGKGGNDEGKEGGKEGSGEGPVVPLDSFLVNLNEPASARYLKATLELEVSDALAAEDLKKQMRGIRDVLLRYLSSLSVADTLGEAGKEKIEASVKERIENEIGHRKVKRLFFTEFMVQ
jgi:flagellar basal body-associated protein FliL